MVDEEVLAAELKMDLAKQAARFVRQEQLVEAALWVTRRNEVG